MKKRKIFDTHTHLGKWNNNRDYLKSDLDIFFNTEDKIVVSNLDCIYEDGILGEIEGSKKLIEQLRDDKRYLILAVCEPNITGGKTDALEKLCSEYIKTIKGLKFHPRAMNLSVLYDIELYKPYLQFARLCALPCLFHTEGIDCSDVDYIYDLAKLYPDVPVILGHMGAGSEIAHNKAIKVFENSLKNNDANLYIELSWVDFKDGLPSNEKPSVVKVINTAIKYGAEDKILFGTDAPLGCYGERLERGLSAKEAYDYSIYSLEEVIDKNFSYIAQELKDKIFFDNAAKLYGI